MKKVRAGSLSKGDLIYYQDSYFVVVSDERYDVIEGLCIPSRPGSSYPYVLTKCYMCPTNAVGIAIGLSRYINVTVEVLLLC